MKLGTTLLSCHQEGITGALKSASKAGFRYVDFGLCEDYGVARKDEEKFFGEIRSIMCDCGISAQQTHAPAIIEISDNQEPFSSEKFKQEVVASIRRTAILGAPYLVMHLNIPYGKNWQNTRYDYSVFAEENFKRNIDFCEYLKPYLKEYGVTLALENLAAYDFSRKVIELTTCCTSEDCNRYIDALGDELFCVCLDAGHLNLMKGETHDEFITNVHGRVKVLHLHDNFGALNDWFGDADRHLPPFFGTLQWDKLAESLRKNNFTGVYSFEVKGYMPKEYIEREYEYLFEMGKRIFYKL
jgi:sugar phosphate isomerase/epimerase